eukprot:GHUV01020250.1.p1 GENE.GHUV01020250.1~~GHUV01020250.1.p1  ORF type:complete len:141 (-),score=7.20 GHUV01020250.1:377-799(-)
MLYRPTCIGGNEVRVQLLHYTKPEIVLTSRAQVTPTRVTEPDLQKTTGQRKSIGYQDGRYKCSVWLCIARPCWGQRSGSEIRTTEPQTTSCIWVKGPPINLHHCPLCAHASSSCLGDAASMVPAWLPGQSSSVLSDTTTD